MRHTGLRLLAASSVLLAGLAGAATRPHYGGGLRVTVQSSLTSLDPASGQTSELTQSNIARLIFDTLVVLDVQGKARPSLAVSWQAEPSLQRWQFTLRPGVRFHDGLPLTSDVVAASLRLANPGWKIVALGDSVVIESDSPRPDLPAELARSRDAIVRRDGKLLGTGPFSVTDWQPGKKLTVAAQDGYWGGRPFADSIQIDMGRSIREEMMALDLGRADVIEVTPEQAHRAAAEGRRVVHSAPSELVALVFARDRQGPEDGRLREALALTIDRQTITSVLLQGEGVPAGTILPDWMSGYAFLFSIEADLARARQVRSEIRQAPAWTLGYDANDPLARLIAERVALNARDAGIILQVSSSITADLRIVRIPLASLEPRIALATSAANMNLLQPKFGGNAVEDLYTAENTLLQSQRVIPLLHLPATYGLSDAVKNWDQESTGLWHLENTWVGQDKP